MTSMSMGSALAIDLFRSVLTLHYNSRFILFFELDEGMDHTTQFTLSQKGPSALHEKDQPSSIISNF